MTEVNGLHLAYRGFIAGLVGGYVWVAIAMLLAWPFGHPLDPLQLLASIGPEGMSASPQEAFVLGLGLVQGACGAIGIGFAYFFARFFTVRATLAIAGPCVALLSWAVLSERLAAAIGLAGWQVGAPLALLVATICYGLVLGSAVPLRGQVMRSTAAPAG
ncbi:MAG: hypothetical protein ACRDGV_00620 [Candidatus Limnocylindria bacterium]